MGLIDGNKDGKQLREIQNLHIVWKLVCSGCNLHLMHPKSNKNLFHHLGMFSGRCPSADPVRSTTLGMCNLFPGAQNEGTNVARDLPEFNGTTKQGVLEISWRKVNCRCFPSSEWDWDALPCAIVWISCVKSNQFGHRAA